MALSPNSAMRPSPTFAILFPLCGIATAGEITLEAKPFTIERPLSATVLPIRASNGDAKAANGNGPRPLRIDADLWTAFEIKTILPHGSRVQAGDTLVSFETSAIDRKLEDSRKAVESATLALAQSETELKALKDGFPLKLESAKRAARNAADDLAYFTNISRKAQEERALETEKRSRQALENEREELRQLEKMYKADDLTEETEEIILQRQRDSVVSGEFSLRMAEMERKRTLETTLPRQAEEFDSGARQSSIALVKAEAELPRQLTQKEAELATARLAFARQKEDLAKLEADRKKMEPVKALAAGWFYHGAIEDGRWTTGEAVKALVPSGQIAAHRPFATLVPADSPLGLVAFAEEAVARSLEKGQAGPLTLPGREELAVTATVASVAAIPGTDGRYRVDLGVVWPENTAPAPGSSAQVRLIPYENPSALTVPVAALRPVKDGWTVTVKLADGATSPRPVKRGRVSGDQAEILSGVDAGQVVIVP